MHEWENWGPGMGTVCQWKQVHNHGLQTGDADAESIPSALAFKWPAWHLSFPLPLSPQLFLACPLFLLFTSCFLYWAWLCAWLCLCCCVQLICWMQYTITAVRQGCSLGCAQGVKGNSISLVRFLPNSGNRLRQLRFIQVYIYPHRKVLLLWNRNVSF